MQARGGFGLLRVLFWLVILAIVGGIAYNAGLAAGSATNGAVVTVVPGFFGFGFGFLLFPILVFLLIAGLAAAFGGRHRGWGGPGGPGGWGWGPRPGGWAKHGEHGPDDLPPMVRTMLEGWHSGAHRTTAEADADTGAGAPKPEA